MTTKVKRRAVRISSADDDLLVEAAGVLGISVTEFILDCARAEAAAIVQARRSVNLDDASFARFMQALDAPAAPPAALVDQARKARPLQRVD